MAYYDVFISHASEDKETIARPLGRALLKKGYSVYLDELVIKMGDSISTSINEGLAKSKNAILIISPEFINKNWTIAELTAITNMHISGNKRILPIWHNITYDEIRKKFPLIVDYRAEESSIGIEALVKAIQNAVGEPKQSRNIKTNYTWNFYDLSPVLQISILRNIEMICGDDSIAHIKYRSVLEETYTFLSSLNKRKLKKVVCSELTKALENIEGMIRADETDLLYGR